MKKSLRNSLLVAAATMGVSGMANAVETWTINYADSNTAGTLGATTPATSKLVDEYKYTAESLVLFHDNDNSGGISKGDTYDDFIVYRIDGLNLGGNTTGDFSYTNQVMQISGKLIASGLQIDANNYAVQTASIWFYIDAPADTGDAADCGLSGSGFEANCGDGTGADFGDLDTFVDGLLVQTGVGSGVGTNSGLVPDGNINIDFALTDLLSQETCGVDPQGADSPCGVFELDLFADLDAIKFITDSNNNACSPIGDAVCGGSFGALAAFFGINPDDYDFGFYTRSDGSATKIPVPATLALMGLGLLAGAGFGRKKAAR